MYVYNGILGVELKKPPILFPNHVPYPPAKTLTYIHIVAPYIFRMKVLLF